MPPSLTKSKAVFGCQGALLPTLFKTKTGREVLPSPTVNFQGHFVCQYPAAAAESIWKASMGQIWAWPPLFLLPFYSRGSCILTVCQEWGEDGLATRGHSQTHKGGSTKFSIGFKLRRWGTPTSGRHFWLWYVGIQANIWEGQFSRGLMKFQIWKKILNHFLNQIWQLVGGTQTLLQSSSVIFGKF